MKEQVISLKDAVWFSECPGDRGLGLSEYFSWNKFKNNWGNWRWERGLTTPSGEAIYDLKILKADELVRASVETKGQVFAVKKGGLSHFKSF